MYGCMWRAAVLAGSLALAACGGSTDEPEASVSPPAEADSSSTTAPVVDETLPPVDETLPPVDDAAGAVPSLEGVRSAVVRIVGTGSFADPMGGMQANVPGSGSGFFVDPTGVIVTNNHVVTGSAKLEVYLDGDDEPHLARVLGVSECSDLAAIQLVEPAGQEAEGLAYLDWRIEPVTAGTQIYVAGFPLGDAEFTLVDGVVSKEDADGDSSWASVQSVIEHSADTLPGSSGGPVVDAEGRVVAVNFAGNDLGQSFGIGRDVAGPVVDQLVEGVDLDSIGINGEAVVEGEASGIFVYSVQSGSPADVAGIRPGDVLVTMESITLGTDGTMRDYCDVLRSHTSTATMGIEVYRPDDDGWYEGQINGRDLVRVDDDAVAAPADPPPDDPATADPPFDFELRTDDSDVISVWVPDTWSYTYGALWDAGTWLDGEPFDVPALTVAADIGALEDWSRSSLFIAALPPGMWTMEYVLDQDVFPGCSYEGRSAYDDGFYTGLVDRWVDCDGLGNEVLAIVAEPIDQRWLGLAEVYLAPGEHPSVYEMIESTWAISDLGG